jgi:5-dehydro-4-deoxyglucarate dehydratase
MSAVSLAGLWGFPLTPFTPDGAVDANGLVELTCHQTEADVLVAAGAIAETAALTPAERRLVTEVVLEVAGSRTPVLVTVPEDRDEALSLGAFAASRGARGLLVLPPADGNLVTLAAHIAALARIGLDLVLYQRGNLRLEPDDLMRLTAVERLVGLKDGLGDLRRFRRLREAARGRLCFAAAWEDLALPYWAAGADALAPASLAHDPWYARAWYERLRGSDRDGAAQQLERFAHPFSDLRRSRAGIDVAVVKRALGRRNLPAGPVRSPGVALTKSEARRTDALLDALDDLRARVSGLRTG